MIISCVSGVDYKLFEIGRLLDLLFSEADGFCSRGWMPHAQLLFSALTYCLIWAAFVAKSSHNSSHLQSLTTATEQIGKT